MEAIEHAIGATVNGPFGPDGVRGPFGNADTGVAVLSIVLRFTLGVLVVIGIIWVIREILLAVRAHRSPLPPPPNPAVAELEMLYARGEVNRTEYLTRRADLTGVPHTAPPPS